MAKLKVLPSPGSLSRRIALPIIWIRRLLMERPRPVPCCLEGFLPEACSKERKTLSLSSFAMPIPVSRTAKDTRIPSSPASFSQTSSVTLPLTGVNFTAFPRRLISTWLIRIRSAYSH